MKLRERSSQTKLKFNFKQINRIKKKKQIQRAKRNGDKEEQTKRQK